MIRWEQKRPAEVRDYHHDWTPYLGANDVITSVSHIAEGVTLVSHAIDADGKGLTVWLSGGTEGGTGRLTQTIGTTAGRTETEVFVLPISGDEPVSLAEARAHTRAVDSPEEDHLLASYIRAARIYVEKESGWVLQRRSFSQHFRYWHQYIELDRRPVISVDSILYDDATGVQSALTGYVLRLGADSARIYPPSNGFPLIASNGRAIVTYTAGFSEGGEGAEEYELARQAILMLVAHWYSFREAGSDRVVHDVPFAVGALVSRFRTQVA